MSGQVLEKISNHPGMYLFRCPGCEYPHQVTTHRARPEEHVWSFNGDLERPTFQPSLLVENRGSSGGACDQGTDSFITGGQIQFLWDCTHSLAGQTVPLEPWRPRGECQEGDLS
jgi:hypothetical protein